MAAVELEERLREGLLYLSSVLGPRPAGSKTNYKALRFMKRGFELLGLNVTEEAFNFMSYEAEDWRLAIKVGGEQAFEEPSSLPCVASPTASVQGELVDAGYATDEELSSLEVKDKIILARIGRLHESIKAERACDRGALGMILFSEEDEWGIYNGRLRYPLGSIPALCVSLKEGLRLAKLCREERTRVTLEVKGRLREAEGRNLVADLEAKGLKEGFILITAHRDTRPHSPGANDNASGSVAMLELARLLAPEGRRPKRRVRFLSTDGEEYGLRGSLHYAEEHAEELKGCVANLNMDSIGQGLEHVVEKDRAGALSAQLNELIIEVGKGMGIDVRRRRSFQGGSDCDAFSTRGIPAAWLRCWPSTSFNTTTDTFDKLDYGLMARVVRLGAKVIEVLGELDGGGHEL